MCGMDVTAYIETLDAPVAEALAPWARRAADASLGRCRLVRLKKGETLARMLDCCDHVHVLARGRIRSTSHSADGGSFTIDEFGAPTVFGEMELLSDEPLALSSLAALTDCELVAIPREDYLAWLASDPEALLARSRWVVRRLLNQMGNERSLMGWNGTKRLMFVLFQLCQQAGVETGGSGANGDASKDVLLHPTRAELAERAGVSEKTITRGLAELEREGLIAKKGRTIVIDQAARERLEQNIRKELEPSL